MRRIAATMMVLAGLSSLALAEGPVMDFGAAVRKFSAARYELAQALSSRLDLPLPPQADAFFRAAVTGNWESVSNRFEQVKEQGAFFGAIPELRNELWAPVHETLGIWEVWVGWKEDSSLLELFHGPILASMPKGSIYLGGTDCGRFVITTVNALGPGSNVFCITQNALADNTYMAHLRAVYGKELWIPQQQDSSMAFQQYVQDVQSGRRPAGADIKVENGRVSVQGVNGVMAINGILCRMIFDHNKDKHAFFVEESYVLDWMYPYLEPCGLIMKLNPSPVDKLSEQAVADDRKFWGRYEGLLEGHPGFASNLEAKKAFSKLRSAIAGLYASRKMYDEAETAFRQAIRLCGMSPEASFRLAKMFEEEGRMAEAAKVMAAYLECVPRESKAEDYLRQLKEKMREEAQSGDRAVAPGPQDTGRSEEAR